MQNKVSFTANPRTLQGKKVKQLRIDGSVPANIINPNHESTMISMGQSDFIRLYAKVGDTGLIYLTIQGQPGEVPVLVEDVVFHPVTGVPEHVVFRQVNLKEKIEAEVPVELVGENTVKDAVVITVVNEITVEALPANLPEKFEVDISGLTEIGQAITYADLQFDRDKVILKLGDEDETSPVVLLQEVKEEVVEQPEVDETAAAEATTDQPGGDAAAAESETPQSAE